MTSEAAQPTATTTSMPPPIEVPQPTPPAPATEPPPTAALPEPMLSEPGSTVSGAGGEPSAPTGPSGLQVLDIAIPEGCTGKASALIGSGRCLVELTCGDSPTSTQCYGSDTEWECTCEGGAGAARGVFEGLDHAGACETAARLCATGEFPSPDPERCTTRSESSDLTSCSTRFDCSASIDLGDDALFTRTIYASNQCRELPTEFGGDWQCDCRDEYDSLSLRVSPASESSGTCHATQSSCLDIDAVVIAGLPTCVQDGQSLSPTSCTLRKTCSLPAQAGAESLVVLFHVTGSCSADGEDSWDCSAGSEVRPRTTLTLSTATTVLDNCRLVVDEHITRELPRPAPGDADAGAP